MKALRRKDNNEWLGGIDESGGYTSKIPKLFNEPDSVGQIEKWYENNGWSRMDLSDYELIEIEIVEKRKA